MVKTSSKRKLQATKGETPEEVSHAFDRKINQGFSSGFIFGFSFGRLLWWLAWLAALTAIYMLLGEVIAPFLTAFALAWLLNPLCENLTRRLANIFASSPASLWRAVVALLLTLALLAMLILLLSATLPFLLNETLELIAAAPKIASNLQSKIEGMALIKKWQHLLLPVWDSIRNSNPDLSQWQNLANQAFTYSSRLFSHALNTLSKQTSSIFAIFSWFVLVPFATFYLLKDWNKAIHACRNRIPQREQHLVLLFARIDEALSALIRGQASVLSIMAFFYALLLTVIGLPYGFAIGIAAGISMLLPYIGSFLSTATALLVAYVHFGISSPFALTLAIFFVGQVLESYFLTPRLVGKKIGLHPLWVIFCILAGGKIAGFLGILVALPVGATIRAVMVHIDQRK